MKKHLITLAFLLLISTSYGARLELPIDGFSRTAAAPLDSSMVFTNLADLQDYVDNNPLSYLGQFFILAEDSKSSRIFTRNSNGDLEEFISGDTVTPFNPSGYLYIQDGLPSVVNTDNRESGMFIQWIEEEGGTNFYTHDFSSVRYVIGPNPEMIDPTSEFYGGDGIWSNKSDKLEFQISEDLGISPITITVTNLGTNSQTDKARAIVIFERNTNAVFGNNIVGLDSNGEYVTNSNAEFVKFIQGNGVSVTHAINQSEKLSELTFGFDGETISNLTYRGLFDENAVYETNEIVTVETDLRSDKSPTSTEQRVLGFNYFLDSFISKSTSGPFSGVVPNVSGIDPFDNTDQYWRPFTSRGKRGFDGVGNIQFAGIFGNATDYGSNTLVSADGQLYISLSNITETVRNQYGIAYGIDTEELWRLVVSKGLDGQPGESATSTETFYYFTNQAEILSTTFVGSFNSASDPGVRPFNQYDLVTYLGNTWYWNGPDGSTGNVPGDDPNWVIFIEKGADGSSAIDGLQLFTDIFWKSFSTININDVVSYDGSLWVATQPQVNTDYGTSPPLKIDVDEGVTSNEYWSLIVKAGVDGEPAGVITTLNFKFYEGYELLRSYARNDVIQYDRIDPISGEAKPALWRAKSTLLSGTHSLPAPNSNEWEPLLVSGIDGAPGATLNWRGNWSNGGIDDPPVYYADDIVYHVPTPPAGSSTIGGVWVALQENGGTTIGAKEPGSIDGANYWRRFIRDGVDGSDGVDLVFKGNYIVDYPGGYNTNHLVVYAITAGDSAGGIGLWKPKADGVPTPPNSATWDLVTSGPRGPPGTPGANGISIQGPRGFPGLGNLNYAGIYEPDTEYTTNNLVKHIDAIWYLDAEEVTSNSISNVTPGSLNSPWLKFVENGTDGENAIGDIFFKGEWQGSGTYYTNEMVSLDNALYVVTNAPEVGTTDPPAGNPDTWLKLIEGVQGDIGPVGYYPTNATIINEELILTLNNPSATELNAGNVKGNPGAGLTFRQTWQGGTEYLVNQLVATTSGTYYALQTNTNQDPDVVGTGTYWEIFTPAGPKGDQGDQGNSVSGAQVSGDNLFITIENQGPVNAGNVRGPAGAALTFRQNWNSGTPYVESNLVYYAGGTYYAIQNSIGVIPTNESYWTRFTLPGAELIPSGVWNSAIPYGTNEIVFHEDTGSSYYSLTDNNTQVPSETATNWRLLAKRGDDGAISSFAWTGLSNEWVNITTINGNVTSQFTQAFIDYLGSIDTDTDTGFTTVNQSGTGSGKVVTNVTFIDRTLTFQYGDDQSGSTINNLSDIGDVSDTQASNGQALIWQTNEWVPGDVATTGGSSTLNELDDVNTGTTAIANGSILEWNSTNSKWEIGEDNVGTTISSLNDISDVNLSSPPSQGQALIYNGTKWTNSVVSTVDTLNDLSNVQLPSLPSTPGDGDALIYSTSNSKWINGPIVATTTNATSLELNSVALNGSINLDIDQFSYDDGTTTISIKDGAVIDGIFSGDGSALTGITAVAENATELTFSGTALNGQRPLNTSHFSTNNNQISIIGGGGTLDDLTDVDVAGALNDKILRKVSGEWVDSSETDPVFVAASNLFLKADTLDAELDDKSISILSDVDITSPSNGEILTYTNSVWTNLPIDISSKSLGDLSDVNLSTAPAENDVLTYTGSEWISQTPGAFEVTATNATLIKIGSDTFPGTTVFSSNLFTTANIGGQTNVILKSVITAFQLDSDGNLMPRTADNIYDPFWAVDGNGDLYPVLP